MNATLLKRIKASKQLEAAQKAAEEAAKKHEQEKNEKRMSGLWDIIEQVADHPSRHFRHGSTKVVPFRENIYGKVEHREASLIFWDSFGDFGLDFRSYDGAIWVKKYPADSKVYPNKKCIEPGPTAMTPEQAEQILVDHIAEYLIID